MSVSLGGINGSAQIASVHPFVRALVRRVLSIAILVLVCARYLAVDSLDKSSQQLFVIEDWFGQDAAFEYEYEELTAQSRLPHGATKLIRNIPV